MSKNSYLKIPFSSSLARMLLFHPLMMKLVPIFAISAFVLASTLLIISPALADFTEVRQKTTVQNGFGDPNQANQSFSYGNRTQSNGSNPMDYYNERRGGGTSDPNLQYNYQNGFNRNQPSNYYSPYSSYNSSAGSTSSVLNLGVDLFDLFTGNFTDSFWELIKNDIIRPLGGGLLGQVAGGNSGDIWTQLTQASGLNQFNLNNSAYGNCPQGGSCTSYSQNPFASNQNIMTNQGNGQFWNQAQSKSTLGQISGTRGESTHPDGSRTR